MPPQTCYALSLQLLVLSGLCAADPAAAELLPAAITVAAASSPAPVQSRTLSPAANWALGALPVLPADGFPALIADWRPEPPSEDGPVGLLLVGLELQLARQVCRIERISHGADGLEVELGLWSAVPDDKAQAEPLRPAWLLRLPPGSAGAGRIACTLAVHQQDAATGLASTLRMPGIFPRDAGRRGSIPFAPLGNGPRVQADGAWLPGARCAGELTLPGLPEGEGVLGIRRLNTRALTDRLDRSEPLTPDLLAERVEGTPVLIVRTPLLNSGEWSSLRSARWTAPDQLEVAITLWRDDLGRNKNIPRRDVWFLPLHTTAGTAARVQIDWQLRKLVTDAGRQCGWYVPDQRKPLALPQAQEAEQVPAPSGF